MEAGLTRELLVNMERMVVLPPGALPAVMGWLADISAPWCSTEQLLAEVPPLPGLGGVPVYFG